MGTMKEAEMKAARRFYIGFGVIIAILMFITYAGIPSNFLHDWFVAAPNYKYASIVTYLLAFFWVYRADRLTVGEKSGAVFGIVAGLFLVLSICLSAGFNFDLK